MLRTWLASSSFLLVFSGACADGGGSRGGDFSGDQDPVEDGEPDDGADDENPGLPDDDDGSSEPDSGSDGDGDGFEPADAGADGAQPGILDPVLEYTTCEPAEINPVVECLTVTCTMTLDPVALVTCMLDKCAPLVEAVNPKCKECITAAVAQDTAGLLENCLKLEEVVGDAGLPF